MASRLDRLFLLLENGGSEATRQAAALQLGEVVRFHPHELETLLDRLHSFITSKSWETRIAASQAVDAIISNIPKWDPTPSKEREDHNNHSSKNSNESMGHLSLESFNIKRVLEKGSYLLGADETQFELEDENTKLDPKERAVRQRLLVNQRLGLDIADALGIDTQNIFSNSDLIGYNPVNEVNSRDSVVQIVQEEMASAGLKMSSRELNRAKRKAKFLCKQKSCDPTDKSLEEGSEKKRLKLHHNEEMESDEDENLLTIADDKGFNEQDGDWPLDEFAEHLSRDLFSCSWETRHGVATALREVIRIQGAGAGKANYHAVEQMETSHLSWLEDKAIRLVCVLALDRFGDFLADQVVAPVRETCAQALGCIVQYLPERIVMAILSLLQEMLLWQDWGTRHGGLLGLKYLLAVRSDMRQGLLTKAYEFIYKGLQDDMDDVVAVAATCLVPVAEDLVEFLPCDIINELIGTLWEALLDIDDLTASTNSILLLISKLLSHPKILNKFHGDLSQLIPRLWPFLYHSSCSIRTSSLKAIETLLENWSSNRKPEKKEMEVKNIKLEGCLENWKQFGEIKTEPEESVDVKVECVDEEINHDAGGLESMEIKKEANMTTPSNLLNFNSVDDSRSNNLLGLDVKKDEEETKRKSEVKSEKMDDPTDSEGENAETWLEAILEPLLVHIYQRALLENKKENINLIVKIWNLVLINVQLSSLLLVSCRLVPTWLCLLMTSTKLPLDPNLLVFAYHSRSGDGLRKTRRLSELGESVNKVESKYYLGGPRDYMDDRTLEDQVIMARCTASKLLGNLSHYVSQPMPSIEYQPDETPILCYVRLLVGHLNSRCATQRYGAGLVVREWAIQHPYTLCHSLLKASLLNCVTETIYYDEITWMFTRLQQEAKDFIAMLKHYKISVDPAFSSPPILTLEQIKKLCDYYASSSSSVKLRKNISETLESRSKSIQKNVAQTSSDQIRLSIMTQSVISGALVRFQSLPEKLNPVIKPLMESIKKEANEQQQRMASTDLTFLLELCVDRQPSPNAKVVKNLCSFLCVDEDFTPNIINHPSANLRGGIISLTMQQKVKNDRLLRRNSSSSGRGPGRPPLKSTPSTSSESGDAIVESPEDIEMKKQNVIQRRGCTMALLSIVTHFGSDLGKKLPHLLDMMFGPLESPPTGELNLEATQDVINWLQLLEIVTPVLDQELIAKLESLLSVFDLWFYHPYSGVRHMAGRAFASLGSVSTNTVVCYMLENVIGKLDVSGPREQRMGALECIHLTIEKLGFAIVPYIVLLIVPLLGCMSDSEEKVRHLGTQCFATLIRLFPLDGSVSTSLNISSQLQSRIAKERVFLDRLIDPKKIDNYKVPVPINAVLRTYQQQGVNWLAFLNKYNLHGILCDDMGLGKTLQSICILAGDHYEKETLFKKNKEKSSLAPCKKGYQSLVVCPPTLTGHWYYEVVKFVSKEYLNPLHYTGPPIERKRLRHFFRDHNLIIASYKIVRNEVDFFSQIKWNYIILDEGHTIKNGKTKSSKAIKELVGRHRVILTGTPIQNNVIELWSLFDFLMPGFLGTERQFMSKFSKPIVQSKEAKSSSKEQEAGVLALEALHRQALPFLLRRVKEDVLKDLPPKITQDYYCDLSPLQERLYEDFTRSQACHSIDQTLNPEEKGKSHGHIFQALQYLRRVCNHPKLALLPSHPQYEAISKQMQQSRTSLSDISNSAKLPALKQLLLDCGIGSSEETSNSNFTAGAVVSPHRALVFCQLKGMLDIIENDLLKVHLPTVTYLRLDGSVPAGSRHSLVQRFNTDPSIDLLLLTTHVGGLGLNLTGADMVIFVEHDWNPMRDLQAMDRAHRIGQKRVVNVYRLITKGTLEEKIMSLQKFKLMTANSVISQENSSLLSMGTDQLLELFTLDGKGSSSEAKAESSNGDDRQTLGLKGQGVKGAIENLPALWEEGLYEEEYNLDTFLKTLK